MGIKKRSVLLLIQVTKTISLLQLKLDVLDVLLGDVNHLINFFHIYLHVIGCNFGQLTKHSHFLDDQTHFA